MKKSTACLLIALTLATSQLVAQNDSIKNLAKDSLLNSQFAQTTAIFSQEDSTQMADSLEALSIEKQIINLRTSDTRRKEMLQARLDSLTAAKLQREERIRLQVDSLRAQNTGVPVILYRDTLFEIYTKLGPFPPSQRAASIAQKLTALTEKDNFDREKLFVYAGPESHDIMYGDMIILSVTDRDAFWLDRSRAAVAESYLDLISEHVEAYRAENSTANTLWRFAMLALVLIGFGIGIGLMNRGFTYINKRLLDQGKRFMNGVKLKDYELLSAEREKNVIRVVLKSVKWILIILIVYLALPAIFSIFPATEGIAYTLISYVLDPLKEFAQALLAYIPSLISIAVIIFVAHQFVRLLKFLASEIKMGNLQVPGFYPEWATPTLNLVKIIVYAFTFVVIFPYLPGSGSPVFQGVSVFLGLLISLGSSSAISNIIAGLVITYMRAFRIGDRVRIGDVTGDVMEKTLLVTRLRTIKNEEVSIPNSAILSGSTINYSASARDKGLILHSTVTIGYDAPWREVHQLLISSALSVEHVQKTPEPYVLQTSLDDFYVSYQINFTTYQAGLSAKIYSQLHSQIQDQFNKAGIEIMSPHYRAARDGNMTTTPADYLPKDYKVPVWHMPAKDGKS